MKVGIIVHSQTGNTLSVAQKLEEALRAAGHSVQMERLTAVNSNPQARPVTLKAVPDPDPYDTLIFAAPVQGFSMSPVMAAYLAKVSTLQNKPVGCFVTQAFPFPWMGGNRAIGQMVDACQGLGAAVFGTGIVNWSNGRVRKIARVVDTLSQRGEK